MRRPYGWAWALWMWWIAFLVTVPARATAPGDRAAQERLEDELVEGEIDAEDFLAWHLAQRSLVGTGGGGTAYVGIEAFRADKAVGPSEVGALLVLGLPLERFGRSHALVAPTSFETPIAQTAAPRLERAPAAPVLTVTPEVARSCVRAALRAMGLGDDNRLDSLAARARTSAALPELRVRAVRTLGETGRVSLSEDDPSRYVASGAATNLLEARVTFRLDRLLFADEEIAVERARLDRSELRARTSAKVLQALFEWQKAYAQSQDAGLAPEDRWIAIVREAEASAVLDLLTGGWFGAFRAALAARTP